MPPQREHSHVTALGAPASSAWGPFVTTFWDSSSSRGFSFFSAVGPAVGWAGGRGSADGVAGACLGKGCEVSPASARETGLQLNTLGC